MNDAMQHSRLGPRQFSLSAVFQYTALCAACCALSPCTGPAASLFLMLMALALGTKQGLAALTMLAAASIAADWKIHSINIANNNLRQIAVFILAAAICGGYLLRQRLFDAPSAAGGDTLDSAGTVPLYEWTSAGWRRLE